MRLLFFVLLLAAGRALAQTPATDPASVQRAAPAPFTSDRIIVTVEGSGPDVILIPGLTSHPRIWSSTVKAVSGYRYHLIQVAGFAGAPNKGNTSGTVAAPVAEEIARYIAEAGLNQPAVIGHSMGGTIGLMLAARHPLTISRLMVVDMLPFMGSMFGPPGVTAEMVRPIADTILLKMRMAVGDARIKQIEAVIRGMINNEAERPAAVADRLNSDTDLVARAFHELVVTDLRPELSRIVVPVTVLYVAQRNAPFTPEQFEAFYKTSYTNLKGATLMRIPNSAHFIMFDAPERFQSEVRRFLRQAS